MKFISATCLVILSLVIVSCHQEEEALKTEYLELPSTPDFYSSGINNHVPTLGRVLFYDKQLSINNSVSCATCHKQSLAFADDVAFSKGFENRLTGRNSMPIQNLDAGQDGSIGIALFWDGRERNLETMVMRPIVNHVEMGIPDLDDLAKKLSTVPYYQQLATKAWGTKQLTSQNISTALASFLRSIRSNNTALDRHFKSDVPLSPLEKEGFNLFFSIYQCNTCHQVQDPKGYIHAGTFANIGLDQTSEDKGLQNVTNKPSDAGKFKIPSLRNVALTAPYMHDGRFSTLEEVIEHYSHGVKNSPTLDVKLREMDGQPIQRNITDHEKEAIIAFLHTLTDYTMITDPKFSNPFKAK